MKRDTKVRRWIRGFWSFLPWPLVVSHCREEDWKEKTKKKRYVMAQQMNTSSIPSNPPCLQIYSPRGPLSGFIELRVRFEGMCSHQNLGRCTGSPKLRKACMSVECRPNFQHRRHHLERREPSYTSSSLMRAPLIMYLNCT